MKRSTPLRATPATARLTVKTAKCRAPGCRARFVPRFAKHEWCSEDCGAALAQARVAQAKARSAKAAAKVERAKDKDKREAIKTLPDLVKEAQREFNAYVRLRDITAGHGCIDCGRPFEPDRPGGSVDAGHYLSRGSAPHLRFDERNCFAQRKNCNRPGGTTRQAFRAGVIERIGLAAVEALEADQTPRKYSRDELRAIRDDYRARVRAMKKGGA